MPNDPGIYGPATNGRGLTRERPRACDATIVRSDYLVEFLSRLRGIADMPSDPRGADVLRDLVDRFEREEPFIDA